MSHEQEIRTNREGRQFQVCSCGWRGACRDDVGYLERDWRRHLLRNGAAILVQSAMTGRKKIVLVR